tara:strand:+ start:452 stop:1273 length:822 start_codon:yes stop_codon:yes gene_type:complete
MLILSNLAITQFLTADVSLDLRNVSKNHHLLLNDFKKEVKNYFENTVFSEHDLDLGIPIKIHIVIESINKNGPQSIKAQFFTSNNLDLNQYSKSCHFPYSRGESINYGSEFDPLSSLLDYFAYIFLANELDMYSPLQGNHFFSIAEKISIDGKDSKYSSGWEDRWKKIKKINENTYLRKFRYHVYELKYYTDHPTKENQMAISKLIPEIENDIYYLKEFFPNDRNVFLFLDIHTNSLAKILSKLKMYDALVMLMNYDVNNKAIYSKAIDTAND